MKKAIPIFILLVLSRFCFGQNDSISSHGFYIPKNINECNQQLDKTFGKKAKDKLNQLYENQLNCDYGFPSVSGIYILSEWFENDSTRLACYLKQYSIKEPGERDYIITLAYYRYLNKKPIDLNSESKKLTHIKDSISFSDVEKYKIDVASDSIKGVFIPTDIFSCCKQLDLLLCDSTKQNIREKKDEMELAEYHFSIGLWMRNNWGLWGGSRLQQYFFSKNVMHPDNMSGIILVAYNKYLNGQNLNIDTIINEQKIRNEKLLMPTAVVEVYKKKRNGKRKICNVNEINEEDFYSDGYKKFLRTRKIKDFDIYEW